MLVRIGHLKFDRENVNDGGCEVNIRNFIEFSFGKFMLDENLRVLFWFGLLFFSSKKLKTVLFFTELILMKI